MKKNNFLEPDNKIIIYQSADGTPSIEVRIENETVWLSQQQIADLYQSSRNNIVEHIGHIYAESELDESATCRKFRQVRTEGNRKVERELPFYNLEMIIALGYRVNSTIATKFRQWATARLREYIVKGFAMDDNRLKEMGGGGYWKELLARIRDIRASEKVFYRQILDIYATSIDYERNVDTSIAFFKKVQNKVHYAVHNQTAAEIIYSRADAEKEFMGLTTFHGARPYLADTVIAKNYLNEKELRALGQIVSGYLDFAERQAEREVPMKMKDWADHLDAILSATGEQLLLGAGSVSHKKAVEKAKREYTKYQAKTLSDVERAYLDSVKTIQKKVEKKVKEQKSKQKKWS